MQTGSPEGPEFPRQDTLNVQRYEKSIQWGDETLTLETGKVARQG